MLSLAEQLASSSRQHRSVRFFSAQETDCDDEEAKAELETSGDQRAAYQEVRWRHLAPARRNSQ